ncbi:enoyl-CoA hydratase [Geotalea uraniireducens]|uniref:Enoyl-CoA hydratase n=1 Tax=Geotalea uraniireducens (strain Rf4) TaxID=351605 RepID=A5GED9_GEOUR|nr:enoyl-CoA hydratase [Geotalea uraniireducens]ABQ25794.1 Enoyl-CoA hydratase [Geotalea uraniireducens Rf4]
MSAASTNEQIQTDLRDGIFTICFNRPEKKNALNLAMYAALVDSLGEADRDDAVRVVLLTGNGECFTSGNDLADFMTAPPISAESPVMQFLAAISRFRKPLVAAVIGSAVGVGVTMLLHCDLVYAGTGAVLQLPFVNLGLCPEAGSTLLFPRLMGHQRAAELLLLGEPFSAEKACSVGIVNGVFPDVEVLAAARTKALQLAARPAAAVRLAKALLKKEYAASLEETIADEGAHFVKRLMSPEAGEALRAFMERRQPDFSRFK